MSHIPFHPAPGFGDLLPGSFVVPQNPVRSDGTPMVPSIQATAPGQVIKLPSLADLVAASFVVPQNPIMPQRGMSGLGCGCGGGCSAQFGADGGANYYALNGLMDSWNGLAGLGDTVTPIVGTDAVSTWLAAQGSIGLTLADNTTLLGFTLPNWGWGAAALGVLYIGSDLFGKGHAASKRYARAYAQNPRIVRVRNMDGFVNATGFHPIRGSKGYDQDRADDPELYSKKRRSKARRKR